MQYGNGTGILWAFWGLNMYMDGKFRQKFEPNFELFDNNKNEFTTEEKLKGRRAIGKKEYIQWVLIVFLVEKLIFRNFII